MMPFFTFPTPADDGISQLRPCLILFCHLDFSWDRRPCLVCSNYTLPLLIVCLSTNQTRSRGPSGYRRRRNPALSQFHMLLALHMRHGRDSTKTPRPITRLGGELLPVFVSLCELGKLRIPYTHAVETWHPTTCVTVVPSSQCRYHGWQAIVSFSTWFRRRSRDGVSEINA
ncbi:hypothetical protein LZ32DRAFT_44985 [Colletotrichum eremochloae]|nr:hypothetical protein LZ32DRAFT_44985 [Colletotrichum eremochloae]